MSSTDRYAEWDAAYVLGALSPAERGEFEQHLAGCPACRTAVGELAGMPGLLAQVPAAEGWAMADEPGGSVPSSSPAPESPRPSTVRRRWQLAAAAVLVVVLGGVGGWALHGVADPDAPSRLAFATVNPSSMTAVVDLVPVSGGTEVKVECQYGDPTPGEAFSIWVVDRSGRGTEVKPWTARPNRVMHPSGLSPLPLRSIDAIEIRSGDQGPVVLRAHR